MTRFYTPNKRKYFCPHCRKVVTRKAVSVDGCHLTCGKPVDDETPFDEDIERMHRVNKARRKKMAAAIEKRPLI